MHKRLFTAKAETILAWTFVSPQEKALWIFLPFRFNNRNGESEKKTITDFSLLWISHESFVIIFGWVLCIDLNRGEIK